MITRRFLLAGSAVGLAAGLGLKATRTRAEEPHVVPPPAEDETPGPRTREVAVVAGGCFWGIQGVFQHVKGVINAVSGYTGGAQATAQYEIVSSGTTGHAESVQITYDPQAITYGRLLQVFFSVAHDPTELNHQGPDWGTQYRTAIFPVNAEQARIARAYVDQLDRSHAFAAAIVTKIEPDRTFYPAEGYHQDYLTRHPNQPYIVFNDLPKLDYLRRLFPDLYRADPVLVATAGKAS